MQTEDQQLRSVPKIQEDYGDLLALYPDHPISRYNGAVRWVSNPLMRWIGHHGMIMNDMAVAYQHGIFSLDDYTKFYRDIGYSLSGFIEIFGEELKLCGEADE